MNKLKHTQTILLFFCFSILAEAQSYEYPSGCFFDKKTFYNNPQFKNSPTRGSNSFPDFVSLKPYAPFVGKQEYTDCTAWACVYSAMTIVESINNDWTNKTVITDYAYSVSFVFNQLKSVEDCDAIGISIDKTLNFLCSNGSLKHRKFGYGCFIPIMKSDKVIAYSHRIENYYGLSTKDKMGIDLYLIKQALSKKKPVVAVIELRESFKAACNGKTYWTKSQKRDYTFGYHALTIIGYDEKRGAFELMNSWGNKWGQSGFIWVKYADLEEIIVGAYVLGNFLNPSNMYAPQTVFEGNIQFRLENKQIMPLIEQDGYFKMKEKYTSETKFRFIYKGEQATCVHVISSDLKKNDALLFVDNEQSSNGLPFLYYKRTFPDNYNSIIMDKITGTDFLCIILGNYSFSIETIFEDFKNTKGSFEKRIQQVLPKISTTTTHVTNENEIHFQAKDEKAIILIMIEIQHI